jgi:hypothetical protein
MEDEKEWSHGGCAARSDPEGCLKVEEARQPRVFVFGAVLPLVEVAPFRQIRTPAVQIAAPPSSANSDVTGRLEEAAARGQNDDFAKRCTKLCARRDGGTP